MQNDGKIVALTGGETVEGQISMIETEETAEYKAFVEKFKPKKTTDDCYTPQNVYEAVRDWAVQEYGLEGREIVRPFWPGGDYEHYDYQSGCVVIDNPPFSILSKICRFYDARGIDYFLFAPSLTLFSINRGQCNYVASDADITYENGANVQTGFVTNLGEYKVTLSGELHRLVKVANEANTKAGNPLPVYVYPHNVINAAQLQKIVCRGIDLRIRPEDATFIRAMDAQRAEGKAIYGSGFLLSTRAAAEKAAAEKAAAEKAAAEKAAATRWPLSDREKAIIAEMDGNISVEG